MRVEAGSEDGELDVCCGKGVDGRIAEGGDLSINVEGVGREDLHAINVEADMGQEMHNNLGQEDP